MRMQSIPKESASSQLNNQTFFGYAANPYPYLTKPLNFELINKETKLLHPVGIHLSEDEVSHLFNQLTKCFYDAINAINTKDLDTMIIRMAEASSLFFRTLYGKLGNCKFIKGYNHTVRSVMEFIYEQCDFNSLLNLDTFNLESLNYLFSICRYVNATTYNYTNESVSERLNPEEEGIYARYYIISNFVAQLEPIPEQIFLQEGIPCNFKNLKQADMDHIDNLVACHVLADPMDEKMVLELQQELTKTELRLKDKLSILRCLNGDVLKKIAQVSLLRNILATRPERKSFYQKLKSACDNEAVARHRNWLYRNPVAQYFFNIPQTDTVQRLNAIAKRMCENDASKNTTVNSVGTQLASRAYG